MPTSTAGKRESSIGGRGTKRAPGRALSSAQAGFSYMMVLAAVVIVGIIVEAAHITTWRIVKADREAELLFRGAAYQRAIRSYYEAGTTMKSFPRTLEDLVKDPRSPNKRHLRALYRDPMATGEKGEWTLVQAADGGIAGVSSASGEEPLKRANFPKDFETFTGATSYREWVFEYVPQVARVPLPPAAKPVAPQSPRTSNPR